mmetsp:Transcript_22532/g.42920  ORF Transcript_22532/g.42920 Transcript_22532/m.42920 type:complete len:222 (-) Transcript_22532:167-832(-)
MSTSAFVAATLGQAAVTAEAPSRKGVQSKGKTHTASEPSRSMTFLNARVNPATPRCATMCRTWASSTFISCSVFHSKGKPPSVLQAGILSLVRGWRSGAGGSIPGGAGGKQKKSIPAVTSNVVWAVSGVLGCSPSVAGSGSPSRGSATTWRSKVMVCSKGFTSSRAETGRPFLPFLSALLGVFLPPDPGLGGMVIQMNHLNGTQTSFATSLYLMLLRSMHC